MIEPPNSHVNVSTQAMNEQSSHGSVPKVLSADKPTVLGQTPSTVGSPVLKSTDKPTVLGQTPSTVG